MSEWGDVSSYVQQIYHTISSECVKGKKIDAYRKHTDITGYSWTSIKSAYERLQKKSLGKSKI